MYDDEYNGESLTTLNQTYPLVECKVSLSEVKCSGWLLALRCLNGAADGAKNCAAVDLARSPSKVWLCHPLPSIHSLAAVTAGTSATSSSVLRCSFTVATAVGASGRLVRPLL